MPRSTPRRAARVTMSTAGETTEPEGKISEVTGTEETTPSETMEMTAMEGAGADTQAPEEESGLVTSIIRPAKSMPRGHRYSPDDYASMVNVAKQHHALGLAYTACAKEQGVSWPTLRKALEAAGEIGGRPSKVDRPSRRQAELRGEVTETPIRSYGAGTMITLKLDGRQLLAQNRDDLIRLLTLGKPEWLQEAVKNLLEQ